MNGPLIIRVDATTSIGSGHVMRCLTIAQELIRSGVHVGFVVSDESSKSFLQNLGLSSTVLNGNPMSLRRSDGLRLAELMQKVGSDGLLIDTYGITDEFACSLKEAHPSCKTFYFDDGYTYATGQQLEPRCWQFDVIVNYTLGASVEDYKAAYRDTSSQILIGAKYAPIRPEFKPSITRNKSQVSSIMVTTGSTNPKHSLERMIMACPEGPRIDVVLGKQAAVSEVLFRNRRIVIHKNITNLSSLMQTCDMAISAGGTTVLELLASGVPTVAVPIVANQIRNVEGLEKLGLGLSATWSTLNATIRRLYECAELRNKIADAAVATVDGNGANRIVKSLMECCQ